MKLHRDLPLGLNLVTAVTADHIEINSQPHRRSLLLMPQRILADWRPQSFSELAAIDFQPILELDCEILLLGTGSRQQFPSSELLRELIAAQIGIEIMDTAAACRTFNILVNEGRKVIAALLIGD